ncbi:MAG: hypothetical protein ACE5JL_04385 [Dehalococcoidia bacterium]
MRNLSATLLQAQKSPSSVPVVKVEVFDRIGGVARLRFQQHYTGSEADYFHAATMPSDGSLIRARIDSAAYDLYIQRVATPTPTSDFSSWSLVTSVSNSGDVALCSQGSTVLLFYVAPNQQTLYVKESNNNGQSFGSPVIVATAPSPVTWMAADLKADGTAVLFYLIGAANLYSVKRSGGSWGTPQLWSNSLSAINGIAAVYYLDWNVMVVGEKSGSPGVWTAVYGDGSAQSQDTWSGLMTLTIAESGSGISFHAPFLEKPGEYRAMFVEKYSGATSYSVPFRSFTVPSAAYVDNLWREPLPFELTSSYGVAIGYSTSEVWLSTPYGVWSAKLDPAPLDVSADVLSLREAVYPNRGEVQIELRNDDGKYYGAGSGSLDMLQKGSEVRISPGYRTSVGDEVSAGSTYWVEGWEFRWGGGSSSMTIFTRDWWGLLEQWRARRQFAWQTGEKNVSGLLIAVLARAGLDFSLGASTSTTMSNHYPAFTIHPGESAATAVRRLLAMVPDVVVFALSACTSINPQASDSSAYSYGTDHVILEARYADPAPDFNRVQVFGDSVFSENFDWTDMPLVYDRLRQVHDINLDTAGKADDQVARELRHQTIDQKRGQVTVRVNAGQELYDVIDLTDDEAGLSGALRRVMGIRTDYSVSGKLPQYVHNLFLGGV